MEIIIGVVIGCFFIGLFGTIALLIVRALLRRIDGGK